MTPPELKLQGLPASPGVAIGRAFFLDTEDMTITGRAISANAVPAELTRFEGALERTRQEILQIQKRISKEMGSEHGEIFNAHLLVLEDRMLIEDVAQRVKKEQRSVESIFSDVLKKYIQIFSRIDDEYLKERIADIEDVGRRVLRNLLGSQRQGMLDLEAPAIVVAYNLSPSDAATMPRNKVIGLATDIGGPTSHTAIMAKALEIPAVVGLGTLSRRVHAGDMLILDGTHGLVIVNPEPETLKRYHQEQAHLIECERELAALKGEPAITQDGHRRILAANVELPSEIASVIEHGAEGIGLYRTEYFYLSREGLPAEEEQYQAYRQVVEEIRPHSVIIRTLDLGGDKFLPHPDMPREMNPFLGWRAIRFSLARPELFIVQLRAILRASAHGNLKVMFPLISSVEEIREAKKIFDLVKKDLTRERIPFGEDIEVGAMIEVPSAAITADLLAKEVDFFSIGTNDLIQYALAVDRANEKIAYLYEPCHPAILRLVKQIIDVGHDHGIWVGMCGEMAGVPSLALLLLGLGLDEFSVSPIHVPLVKCIVRNVTLSTAREIAQEALKLPTGREVAAFAKKELKRLVPFLPTD